MVYILRINHFTMKNETTLLFDLDYTSVDWEGSTSMLHRIWKERFPELEFLGSKKSVLWNIADNYNPEYFDRISEIYKRPEIGYYLSMPPMPGFLEVLPQLAELGHVAFVSTPIARSMFNTDDEESRKEYIKYYNQVSNEKTCWIEEHIAPVLGRMPETVFVQDKSHAHGNVLFDDNPHVAEKVCMKPSWQHILYVGENESFLSNKNKPHRFQTYWGNPHLISTTRHAIKASR